MANAGEFVQMQAIQASWKINAKYIAAIPILELFICLGKDYKKMILENLIEMSLTGKTDVSVIQGKFIEMIQLRKLDDGKPLPLIPSIRLDFYDSHGKPLNWILLKNNSAASIFTPDNHLNLNIPRYSKYCIADFIPNLENLDNVVAMLQFKPPLK